VRMGLPPFAEQLADMRRRHRERATRADQPPATASSARQQYQAATDR
jgi:hypothetical protein